jgi:2-keto-4-pentenoate hydratase
VAEISTAGSPEQVAERIWAAWCSGERLATRPALDGVPAGMAVQDALRAHAGGSYGWKLAATTAAGQAHVDVDGPLPGPLFTRFRREPGEVLASDHLHMRVVEAEFAYRLGADVEPGDDVLAAVAGVHLAVEVPDSRFERFAEVGAAALLADAACAGRFVLGPELPGWGELDLSTATTHLWINGELAASGSGGTVMGDPRTALAWLAAELPRHGHRLRAGDVVTTGTTTVPPTIGPGDEVRAVFDGLGEVPVAFAR